MTGHEKLDTDSARLAAMTDAAEMLWIVVANVSGSDWTKQSPEWQAAARRWVDNYHELVVKIQHPWIAAIADRPDYNITIRWMTKAEAEIKYGIKITATDQPGSTPADSGSTVDSEPSSAADRAEPQDQAPSIADGLPGTR